MQLRGQISGTQAEADPVERARVEGIVHARHGPRIALLLEREPVWARDFTNMAYEWRRLFSELFGTFLLVLVGAGGGVIDACTGGQIGRGAAVVAPALTVLAIILFMGAVPARI